MLSECLTSLHQNMFKRIFKNKITIAFVLIATAFIWHNYYNHDDNYESVMTHDSGCALPNLHAFHSDVLPFIRVPKPEICTTKQHGHVFNGNLVLHLENVWKAGFYYLERVDDFRTRFSKWQPIINDDLFPIKEAAHCLFLSDNFLLFLSSRGGKYYDTADVKSTLQLQARERELNNTCEKTEKFFLDKNNNLVHLASNRCIVPKSSEKESRLSLSNIICDDDSFYKFSIIENKKFKHIASNLCMSYRRLDHTIRLRACHEATEIQLLLSHSIKISHPIRGEFIKLEFIKSGKQHIEYHVSFKDSSSHFKSSPYKPTNIIMIMVDSLSYLNAKRSLKKTYSFLTKDPLSFIMKGHTIVGDGTTAQLCAFLTGKEEHLLPEARKEFAVDEDVLDKWPFIFKDLHKMGFKTWYSEDDQLSGTFQYRLIGFQAQPTTYYLRTLWNKLDQYLYGKGKTCHHQYSLLYLKQFLIENINMNKFALVVLSKLSHEDMNDVSLLDNDLLDFYEFLRKENLFQKSFVFLFGDHGPRTGNFRMTFQGKLEERLPFMTLTTPDDFETAYNGAVENLKENSQILTTHYDVYETLRDIISLNQSKPTFGKSFFKNITALKRGCAKAGIKAHWCPCSAYTNVDTKDVILPTQHIIGYINKMINSNIISKIKCSQVTLKRIIKAHKKSLMKEVIDFYSTERNEVCDSCRVISKSNQPKRFSYEIIFSVEPSDGIYEGTVDVIYSGNQTKFEVFQSVSRINKYENQAECIGSTLPNLKSYCFCK